MYMCTSRGADTKNAMLETVRCRIWIEQCSLRVVSNSDESTVHATNLRTHDTALPISLKNRQWTVYWLLVVHVDNILFGEQQNLRIECKEH